MSHSCCLPFDVTLYIFKVSVLTVFIKLIIKCSEIENKTKRLPCRFKVNSVILNQTAFSFLEECIADIDQQRVCTWVISHHVTQILDLPSYIKYIFLKALLTHSRRLLHGSRYGNAYLEFFSCCFQFTPIHLSSLYFATEHQVILNSCRNL